MAFENAQTVNFGETNAALLRSLKNCGPGKIKKNKMIVGRIPQSIPHTANVSLQLNYRLIEDKVELHDETIVFLVNGTVTLSTSRRVLKQKAPEFSSIFSGGHKFHLNEEPAIFEALLRYIESDELDQNILKEQAIDLFLASDKYRITKLKHIIMEYIRNEDKA